jgi:hypothetical protein
MQVQPFYIVRIIGDAESEIAHGQLALYAFGEFSQRLLGRAYINQFLKIHFKVDLAGKPLQVFYTEECANEFQLQLRIYLHENFRVLKIAHNEVAVNDTGARSRMHPQQAQLRSFPVLSITIRVITFKSK